MPDASNTLVSLGSLYVSVLACTGVQPNFAPSTLACTDQMWFVTVRISETSFVGSSNVRNTTDMLRCETNKVIGKLNVSSAPTRMSRQ